MRRVKAPAGGPGKPPAHPCQRHDIPSEMPRRLEGVALDLAERPRLQQDLGTKNLMLLRNHGTLAVEALKRPVIFWVGAAKPPHARSRRTPLDAFDPPCICPRQGRGTISSSPPQHER